MTIVGQDRVMLVPVRRLIVVGNIDVTAFWALARTAKLPKTGLDS